MNGRDTIRQYVLEVLGRRQIRSTPSALDRELRKIYGSLTREEIRSAINKMVAEGDLVYTNHFNTTHLELNFRKPVRVSPRVILAPHPSALRAGEQNRLFLHLDQGGAFGVGDHPTTRLCIQAVDRIMEIILETGHGDKIWALDIGTGTGILAMVAAGLGAQKVLGIDIDPAALYEAHKNILLNGLNHIVTLTQTPLQAIDEKSKFNLIMANLRPPTLKGYLPKIEDLSAPETYWVFSGSRADEQKNIIAALPVDNTRVLWTADSCGWSVSVVYWHSRI